VIGRSSAPYTAQSATSIIEFITDANLLGSSFEGPSWGRWRAVLKAAFALPLSRRDRELFAEVSGDRAPPRHRVKELVACVGRGGGKDSIASALAVYIATTGDFSRLRKGERGTLMALAVDKSQAGIAFEYTRALLEETPLLRPLIRQVDSNRIRLRNGAEIIVQTNNTRSPRGRTICCAIYDECAHWLGEDYANPDTEVDNAITPGLMRFPGSLKIIISSVHRRAGLLHDRYAKHFGKDDDDVLVVLGTALQFNPTLPEAEIDRQVALDPEKAGAEYLSQWRDDLTNFLDRMLVDTAIDKGVAVRPPKHGASYVAFTDPSGGRGDAFTACVGHRDANNVLVIDSLFEKRAPFDSDATIDEVAALLKSYGVNTVRGDDYGADLTVAAFRRRGIAYKNLKLGDAEGKQGRLNRSEIYLNSVGLFTSGRVRLLDNPRLVHQLISLERRAARSSGHDTVDHPAQGHDDLANACCGCLVALAGKPAPMILKPAQLQRFAAPAQRDRFGAFQPTAFPMAGRNRFARAR
jgi:hypothetical protein